MISPATDQINSARIFGEQEYPVLVIVAHSKNHDYFEANSHPELEFHLIRHGYSQYVINGVNYPCTKNSILMMHSNEPHAWLINKKYADKNLSLFFDKKLLDKREISKSILNTLSSINQLILPDKEANMAEFILNEIADECKNKNTGWQDVAIEYIEAFLTILYRAADEQDTIIENKDTLIQKAIEYLDDKFTGKVSLVEVSKLFNVSQFALSKRFKQHVGVGFREYLIHRRIIAAQELLVETDLKVAAIANKVGFDSLTTFNRDFRMITSVTPAVYRTISETHKNSQ